MIFNGKLEENKRFENYDNVNIDFTLKTTIGDDKIITKITTYENGKFGINFTFDDDNITKTLIFEEIKIYGTPNGNSVGLTKNDISNDFNVYTYNNNLIVKTDDYNTQYEVSVHNMNGQMVMSEKNNGGMETYLQVPNGIYIINLITEDGGRLTKKVSVR